MSLTRSEWWHCHRGRSMAMPRLFPLPSPGGTGCNPAFPTIRAWFCTHLHLHVRLALDEAASALFYPRIPAPQ